MIYHVRDMASQKLTPYKGLLNLPEVADGINAAIRNARRLAEDARVLLKAGRIPTAASIAALSIEEAGKVPVLRQIALATPEKEAARAWKDYRRHTKKNFMWLLPQVVDSGARKLQDFGSLVLPDAEHPQLLDQLKQLGFYTDSYKRGHWHYPEDIIDNDLAESLLHTAELLATSKEVTQQEIELWIKHLSPVWGKGQERMQQALIDWYADMQESGLASSGPNAMEVFIHQGLDVIEDV